MTQPDASRLVSRALRSQAHAALFLRRIQDIDQRASHDVRFMQHPHHLFSQSIGSIM
ncbi:hypothetical protein EMIT0158MI4_80072 [Burkholderia ambifaria]